MSDDLRGGPGSAYPLFGESRVEGPDPDPEERRSGELIRLRGVRGDSGEAHEICWTLAGAVGDEIAVPLELRHKSNWENYPDQMLWARCASQVIRELAPEVTGANFYSTEEIITDEHI